MRVGIEWQRTYIASRKFDVDLPVDEESSCGEIVSQIRRRLKSEDAPAMREASSERMGLVSYCLIDDRGEEVKFGDFDE